MQYWVELSEYEKFFFFFNFFWSEQNKIQKKCELAANIHRWGYIRYIYCIYTYFLNNICYTMTCIFIFVVVDIFFHLNNGEKIEEWNKMADHRSILNTSAMSGWHVGSIKNLCTFGQYLIIQQLWIFGHRKFICTK